MLSKFRKFIVFIRNSKNVALLSLDMLVFFILRLLCLLFYHNALLLLCSNRMWLSYQQYTEESWVSKEISREHGLCVLSFYSAAIKDYLRGL